LLCNYYERWNNLSLYVRKNTPDKFNRDRRPHDSHPLVKCLKNISKNLKKWMKKYHQRSVIETVFSSLKRRLGVFVNSIKHKIQYIKIALKIIVYNLMILAKKIVEEEYF
jgi:transposase